MSPEEQEAWPDGRSMYEVLLSMMGYDEDETTIWRTSQLPFGF